MPRPIVVPPDDAPHLLVVDDDARILALLSRYLTEHGYRVTTTASAAEARAKLESLKFDLLVLDVMMPGESGLDPRPRLRGRSDVPDPDADGAHRAVRAHRRPGVGRRRLSRQAVRAARAAAAHRRHPEAHRRARPSARRSRPSW